MTLPTPGKVYLTGAGPGDPELLTVRAHRLLVTADAIFHDDLVPPSILQLCRPGARIVSVGKRCGSRSITQDEINQMLIEAARSGQSVVRLKGGDPLLYGRASEELAALASAAVPCEVVPGVSAVFAAAAAVPVPLTDRLAASRLIVLTGHRTVSATPSPLWEGDLPPDATVAIYMPGSDYRRIGQSLLDSGMPEDTPCIVVSSAQTPQQQSLRTTVVALRDRDPLPPPAVILAGPALRWREPEPLLRRD
jgi:uroporphyrin-III C-methyltransferase